MGIFMAPNEENIAYYETITPITVWSVILSLAIIASPYIFLIARNL